MTRICSTCKIEQSLSECFYKEKGTKAGKDGYGRRCKDCERIRRRKWFNSNPERAKLYQEKRKKEYRNLLPEEREKYLEKERVRSKEKKKNPNYRIRATERQRQWRKEHPEEYRLDKKMRKHIRRALLRNQLGEFSKEDWKEICNRYNNVCAICKEAKELTVDHIIPLAKGGLHDKDNIQPLCMLCNQKKHAYMPDKLAEIFGEELDLHTSPAPRTHDRYRQLTLPISLG